MAILVLASSQIQPGSNAIFVRSRAGSSSPQGITAGLTVYKSSGRYVLTNAAASNTTKAAVRGMAVNSAFANQPLTIQTGGLITLGKTGGPTTADIGAVEVLDGTAGIIGPDADRASNEVVALVGIMETASRMKFSIVRTTALTP